MSPGIGVVDCNGSIEVSPQGSTEYTLTALNSVLGEEIAVSTTVEVTIIIPSASISAYPSIIELGEPATLTWSSTDADSCTISPDVGPIDCNGSIEVSPPGTTNYIFTAKNTRSGMTASALATIGVKVIMPSASISANPAEIELGESATISWNSTNADKCTISPEIGEVDCDGSVEISPNGTTQYVFTAMNTASGLMAAAMAEVNVSVVMPSASLSASPEEISPGETSTLTWNSTYADECSLLPNIGQVDCNGSMQVAPQSTTDYIFLAKRTVSGTVGSASARVSVVP